MAGYTRAPMDDQVPRELRLLLEVAGLDETQAREAYRGFALWLTAQLKDRGQAMVPEIGKFAVRTRQARRGRNPQTGEVIELPASHVVTFRPSRRLLDSLGASNAQPNARDPDDDDLDFDEDDS